MIFPACFVSLLGGGEALVVIVRVCVWHSLHIGRSSLKSLNGRQKEGLCGDGTPADPPGVALQWRHDLKRPSYFRRYAPLRQLVIGQSLVEQGLKLILRPTMLHAQAKNTRPAQYGCAPHWAAVPASSSH